MTEEHIKLILETDFEYIKPMSFYLEEPAFDPKVHDEGHRGVVYHFLEQDRRATIFNTLNQFRATTHRKMLKQKLAIKQKYRFEVKRKGG